MVNRNLIRSLEDDSMLSELATMAPEQETEDWLLEFLQFAPQQEYIQGRIVDGKIVEINDEWALIDVGFKSEGTVNLNEWGPTEAKPEVGDVVQVLIEEMEDNYGAADDPYGMIALSKNKAEKIIEWEEIIKKIGEGQVVTGTVIRKIKGGLLVDIGVNVFLPGSQVDIRRPGDIGDFIGRVIQAEVLKIDDTRRNIVISRRSLIENQREEDRAYLMQELEVGQIRRGIVKNIADFGAFVDLGGIDGLLHITDMAWERISHPTEMVSIDQEIEVKVLHIDREKQKIALGLKQKDRNPWENIEEKYPVDSNHQGEVVNVMSYGAFVKLEPGIEGLVHISEMSWTKRVNHPSELVNIGDKIEVKILGVDPEGQQLSLGMKQTQKNPWDDVLERYPEGSDVTGKVRNLTNYGAFIELEEGIDGLLHVSDMSWTRKIGHPSEMLEKGQELNCRVLSVDEQRRRIALGLKQLDSDPWDTDIPQNYQPGQLVKGKVTKITNFGVFIGLEDGLEGLLHISELAEHKVENPEEVVKVGDDIEVKVLRVDTDERKIGLSLKRVEWGEEEERAAAEAEAAETDGVPGQDGELKGGLGSGEGPLFPTGG
ncbi:30S ribosomal protein S1 [Stieleria bergensis]|uniref:Small ribosomal subunit protein bS1 n=1 Tax=Stieleria bergensis TaxID=2528025 RepID=A0A517SPZ3_9BACT|nr:MAG: bifunctional 4-hydroxy-3-methylbut-2-enyl diphosphate reductase/30S ribosomal protein S1 [Rhodopirellula sp. TMED11]QDT58188.1 30S ribosomal protein S1 [Planctomycetes bacterium SV_7m_r]